MDSSDTFRISSFVALLLCRTLLHLSSVGIFREENSCSNLCSLSIDVCPCDQDRTALRRHLSAGDSSDYLGNDELSSHYYICLPLVPLFL